MDTSVSKRQRYGQHFLVDHQTIQRIIDLSKIGSDDVVYEVGAGTGNLTNRLCAEASTVTSSEIDKALFKQAKKNLAGLRNLTLENVDGFDRDVRFDIFVASLPYSKSRKFIEWLSSKSFARAVVILQKEFAEKLLSPPTAPTYSAVSAIAQRCMNIRKEDSVPRNAFAPPPQVESVILSMEPRIQTKVEIIRLINLFFSFRRKLVSSMLTKLEHQYNIDFERLLEPIYEQRRVGSLTPDELFSLAANVNNRLRDQ